MRHCKHCGLLYETPDPDFCNDCLADLGKDELCKLGTLDNDNCEIHECTCGYHEKKGDPNV